MATRLKDVDAVMVGMGWTGSIMARELTKAGLTVVGLERGEDMTPGENFALPNIRDELKYTYRLELVQDPALETLTFRHRPSDAALPMRRMGSFLPGNSVGGAANHWGGLHWRYLPSDHLCRSHIVERYGAKVIPEDMTIQDWAMTYDELEPYYDRFDKLCGVSGKAGCEANAKAGPHVCILPLLRSDPKFTLRARAWVSRLVYDKTARKVTGVVYTDTRSGEEYEQPAGLVVLSAYVFGNVSLLLHSGIGEQYDPATQRGTVGKNYCYQLSRMGVTMFFEDRNFNPFMGAPGTQMVIDDFDADNFDHGSLGFLGGAIITCGHGDGRPISYRPTPAGTPRWGSAWKKATARWYQHALNISLSGSNYANRHNYLDLDPTYKDQLGRPLLRMTYNFVDNDYKLSEYCMSKAVQIAKTMKPTILGEPRLRRGDYDIVPYQSTHNTGGTIQGTDPKSSVVNRYLQAWDAHNLFVMGASTFPQNQSYNPTGPLGALAYWSANAITTQYLKNPGPLMHA